MQNMYPSSESFFLVQNFLCGTLGSHKPLFCFGIVVILITLLMTSSQHKCLGIICEDCKLSGQLLLCSAYHTVGMHKNIVTIVMCPLMYPPIGIKVSCLEDILPCSVQISISWGSHLAWTWVKPFEELCQKKTFVDFVDLCLISISITQSHYQLKYL